SGFSGIQRRQSQRPDFVLSEGHHDACDEQELPPGTKGSAMGGGGQRGLRRARYDACARGREPARRGNADAVARGPAPGRQKEMKRIAVLGGGPAGAFAAEQLASAGLNVVLL